MKKILTTLTITIIIFCFGCKDAYPTVEDKRSDYSIIEIDSCEYIKSKGMYTSGYLIHKQNCKYCEERKHPKIPDEIHVVIDTTDLITYGKRKQK
jgi:hypothetical protein